MQALSLRPAFGWLWIRAGWRLFRAQPFAFIALLVFYWLSMIVAFSTVGTIAKGFGTSSLVAAIGVSLVAIVTPLLTVGFMQGCRDAAGATGRTPSPLVLFAPFRAGKAVVTQLLLLGLVETLAFTLILAVARDPEPAVDPPAAATQPAPATTVAKKDPRQEAADELEVQRAAIGRTMRWFPFYLALELVLWYAPMLAAWHGLSATKSIFFSVVAVWRNLGAFAVYGIGWIVIWFVLSFVFGGVAAMIGGPNVAALLTLPLVVLLLTWMFCSKYPTYESVFVLRELPKG